jgi:glycosyltransferase involved in cell wall biosynthesis
MDPGLQLLSPTLVKNHKDKPRRVVNCIHDSSLPPMTARPRRLVYVINDAEFFVRHRMGHVAEAIAEGYDVHILVPPGAATASMIADGATVHALPLARGKASPVRELQTISAIARLYRQLRPQLVHHISVKPVLYGTIVARALGVPGIVNTIPGMGWLFTGEDTAAAVRRKLAIAFYQMALRTQRMRIIVQNPDDRDELVRERIASPESIVVLDGAGIDLDEFRFHEAPDGPPLVVMPARMLRDKGVVEYVEAARALRATTNARFALVGGIDPHNPAGLKESALNEWQSEGVVEWWGHREDMPQILAQAAIVALPSYREGMPRTLLEAAATGRPIVTTEVPGCRQAVIHGETGLLVPSRDSAALARALKTVIDDHALRVRMGRAARAMAERRWDINKIMRETLDVYKTVSSLP